MHILPPLLNAQNHRFISRFASSDASSHRDGSHVSGEGNTSGFRCKVYAFALTRTPPGMLP